MERHSRPAYFVVGEGMVGSDEAPEGAALQLSMDDDLRAFRFSRQGPKGDGRQLGTPNRRRIAAAMTRAGDDQSTGIPAGYTYLGQFVDHDLTFDKSRLRDDATVPVVDLVQGRSPSLDLDSLYGLGPGLTPEFYEADGTRLLTGTTSPSSPNDGFSNKANKGFDLPRRPAGVAIPDARNDENLAVAQTHLAFIRFHNRVVDKLTAEGVPAAQLFAAARDLVVRHYQWMLRTDFLPRITNRPQLNGVFQNGRVVVETDPVPGDPPTMPVEFSVAAYRMGHSMVRPTYEWNGVFESGQSGVADLALLFGFSGTSGGLDADNTLPSNWVADFRGLYRFPAARPDLQPRRHGKNRMNIARRIDTLVADPLADLPEGALGGPEPAAARRNLAFRNLTRARMLQLATGQQMAALMRARGLKIPTLTRAQILNGRDGADLSGLNAPQRDDLARNTPLWFYCLREAELNKGRMTGVGGRLLAETFHRSMEGSAISIVRDPAWRPTVGATPDVFTMVDLLLFAFEGKKALLAPVRGEAPG
jgi:Animal haem peroxidase